MLTVTAYLIAFGDDGKPDRTPQIIEMADIGICWGAEVSGLAS
jgi:hypothetical protein